MSSGIGSRMNGQGDGRRASEWVMCLSHSIRIDLSATGGQHLGSILPSSHVDVEREKTTNRTRRVKKEMDRKKQINREMDKLGKKSAEGESVTKVIKSMEA